MELYAALERYKNICFQGLGNATRKLGATHVPIGNRLKQLVTNILLLHMVLPPKINFTPKERYGVHTEKTCLLRIPYEIALIGRLHNQSSIYGFLIHCPYLRICAFGMDISVDRKQGVIVLFLGVEGIGLKKIVGHWGVIACKNDRAFGT